MTGMALEGCPWLTPGVLLPILTHDAYYAGDGVLSVVRTPLSVSVSRRAALIRRPLRLMVTSFRGLRARMTRLMLIPVAFWSWRVTARCTSP